MNELRDKYDDLNNLVSNLTIATKETNNREYKEELLEIMRRVQIDIEKIEPYIYKQQKAEIKELENQFERSRI